MHASVTDCFEYFAGESPLLISIAHDGRILPPAIAARMTARSRELPDTDWHVIRLYEFAKALGASVIAAKMSRYVVDLNRSQADEALYDNRFVTGVCPQQSFDGHDIYLHGENVSADEKEDRIATYWRPYHDKVAFSISKIKDQFGYALLWDAHSISSEVPLLFEGELPQLNFGTNDGRSCASEMIDAVMAPMATCGSYSSVLNGRFKGGYITRQYGEPASDIHAIQLELAQRSYMSEQTGDFDDLLASQLQKVLDRVLQAFLTAGAAKYGRPE